jgi:hypothetical protein
MSRDPQIDAEIKKLTGLSIWPRGRLLQTMPDPTYLSGLKPATKAMVEADLQVQETAADFQAFVTEVFDLTSETLRESRHYPTPFLTLADWRGKATGLVLSQLRGLVEEAEINVERTREAISMLTASIDDKTKKQVLELCQSILFKRGNISWGIHIYGQTEWEKYANETCEKIQILKAGLTFHEKLITVFRAAIEAREARKPEIEQQIKSAAKLCHDADNLVQKIRKAERVCEDSNYADTKAVKEFVVSWRRLDKLRSEFATLRGSGVEFQDFGKPEPMFPDTSLPTEHAAAVKGRIFTIFEKSQQEK